MEVSVDSIIKKPFCSRNYNKKLEIAKAKKPAPKLDVLSSKLGCLKRRLMLVRASAANIVEEHTSKKCSSYATEIEWEYY